MGFTALSMLTHGWHHPGEVVVTTDNKPWLRAVVEVRPEIRATTPPVAQGAASEPVVVAASELKPEVRDTEGPPQSTGQDEPTVYGAEELAPQIRKAEED